MILDSPALDNEGNVIISTYDGNLYSIGALKPTIPINETFLPGNKYVNFSWDLPIDDGGAEILNFNVYRNTSGNDPELYTSVSASNLFFNDTDVENGVEYFYWISAVNREGESDLAGPFNATPRGPPSVPRNVSVLSGPAYLNISWEGPLSDGGYPIEGYRIYRKEAGIFLLHGETSKQFFIDDVANPGANYSYYVVAFNEYGEGAPTEIFYGISLGVPPPPLPVTIGRYDSEVSLNWSMSLFHLQEYDITHVRVYRDGSLLQEVPFDEGYYNDTGLVNGELYSYQVSSVNFIGEGDLSDEIEAVPGWSPSAPRNISTWANTTMVKIYWDPPEFERGFPVDMYIVYRKTDDGRWINLMNVPASDDPHWNDTYVEKGDTYEYKVVALNQRGMSPEAGPVSATIPMGDPPNAPGDLEAVFENDEVLLTWSYDDSGPEIDSYTVVRTLKDGSEMMEFTSINTEYTDSNIGRNTTYRYIVFAINDFGEGPPTEFVEITIPKEEDPDEKPDENETTNDDEGEFPVWTLIFLIILVISIALVIAFMMFKRKGDDHPGDFGESVDDGLLPNKVVLETRNETEM